MKIGIVQYSPEWENKAANQVKINSLLENTGNDVELYIFPEMTLTGFSMNPVPLAEDLNGSTILFVKELAAQKSAHIFFGMITMHKEKYYNSLVHVNPDSEIEKVYNKLHPFSFAKEDIHYAKGDDIVITRINDFKIGLSICYDLRFPELYRLYAKERVHLMVDIANWPIPRIEHWKTLLKARAIENQCYFAGCNRVGKDLKAEYNGFSSVYDPGGGKMAENENNEVIITAELNLDHVFEIRKRLPFLQDIYLI